MPAAAVIPAPLAYTIIVAVKRLVVGLNDSIVELSASSQLSYTRGDMLLVYPPHTQSLPHTNTHTCALHITAYLANYIVTLLFAL